MEVHTSVDEADVGNVNEGQEVTFTVDAFPARRFRGKVYQVRNAPTIVQNVVTYDAVVRIDNKELLLKPGMTANVQCLVSRKENDSVIIGMASGVTAQGQTGIANPFQPARPGGFGFR